MAKDGSQSYAEKRKRKNFKWVLKNFAKDGHLDLNHLVDKMWHCKPIYLDEVHVKIFCPYCQDIHIHGSCGGKEYPGHRGSHCLNMESVTNASRGYYIDRNEDLELKLN